MLKLLQFYLISLSCCHWLWAGTTERIEVLEVSSSKKTIIIDKGHFRGVRVGDSATFILYSSSEEPLLEFVAYGEAVKVHTNYSFWYLKEIRNKELLVKGEKLQLLAQETYRQGVRPLRAKQEKAILVDGQTEGFYKRSQKEGVPTDRVQFDKDYETGRQLVETTPIEDHDLETIETDMWNKGGTKKIEDYQDEVEIRHLKDQKLSDVRQAKKKEYVDNLKALTLGLEAKSKRKKDWVDQIHIDRKNKVSYTNAYKQSKEQGHDGIQPWAVNKIKRDGSFWSADMSDAELARFFKESGIAHEKARQTFAEGNFLKHELLMAYGLGVGQNTREDDLNNQGQSYSLNLNYEFNLGRTSPKLQLLSLDIGVSAAKNFFDAGTENASSESLDYSLALNFYFYNKPTSMNKYIWFAGVGIKGGNASLSTAGSSTYSYQRQFFPTAKVGMKYRFHVGNLGSDTFGLGAHFYINYEYMKLSSLEDVSSSSLSEVIKVGDVKAVFGLSLYF